MPEKDGFEVKLEHPIKGNGAIDILGIKPGEKIAIEIETGKSDVKQNLLHMKKRDFVQLLNLGV